MYFALQYETAPDYFEKRTPHRGAHLALAQQAHAAGLLLLAGAFKEGDAALLLFRADSPAPVEAFARQDPYVTNGVVVAWRVREWTVVVGGAATFDARPAGA